MLKITPHVLSGIAIFYAANVYASSDPTLLSLEELGEITVASKRPQKADKAFGDTIVLTKRDIANHGWRNLAEALGSVRGFRTYSDNLYSLAGVNGLAPAGDMNMRLLVLVDGVRINENIYDQAMLGNDGPIDIRLVERIEIVRGPGSSLYGGNALLGVVNIVIRKNEDFKNGEVEVGAGNHGNRTGRATIVGENQLGKFLLSASGGKDGGTPGQIMETTGLTHYGADADRHNFGSIFGRLDSGSAITTLSASKRTKHFGAGNYGSDYADPGNAFIENSFFIDVKNADSRGEDSIFWRAFTGGYDFKGIYIMGGDTNLDFAAGRWFGGEVRKTWRLGNHTLSGGGEAQSDYSQRQWNHDVSPYLEWLNVKTTGKRFGVFVDDEIAINDKLTLSIGARADKVTHEKTNVSPRISAIHSDGIDTFKLSHGTAFRAANAFERYYDYLGPGTKQLGGNTGLKPETVTTTQFLWNRQLAKTWTAGAGAFVQNMKNVIGGVYDPIPDTVQYSNMGNAKTTGTFVETVYESGSGIRMRASAEFMRSKDQNGQRLDNSPENAQKFSAFFPIDKLPGNAGFGLEWQRYGSVMAQGQKLDASNIVNASLSFSPAKNMHISLTARNLTDERNFAPSSEEPPYPNRFALSQERRSIFLKATVGF